MWIYCEIEWILLTRREDIRIAYLAPFSAPLVAPDPSAVAAYAVGALATSRGDDRCVTLTPCFRA